MPDQDLNNLVGATSLDLDSSPVDPAVLFEHWYSEVLVAKVPIPNRMVLSTVTEQNGVSSRVVLLKDYTPAGFVFYSNYSSSKARNLSSNSACALNFFWVELALQIRVEGEVTRLPSEISDAYFATRDRASQLGAWASKQSLPMPGRSVLQRNLAHFDKQFADQTVPRPGSWGGYLVEPHTYEFWVGKASRLHDRLRYNRQKNGSWDKEMLYP